MRAEFSEPEVRHIFYRVGQQCVFKDSGGGPGIRGYILLYVLQCDAGLSLQKEDTKVSFHADSSFHGSDIYRQPVSVFFLRGVADMGIGGRRGGGSLHKPPK